MRTRQFSFFLAPYLACIRMILATTADGAPSAEEPLLLEQVLSSVDSHYPLMRGALQDEEKARADLRSAQGGFDPVLKSAYQAMPTGEYENRYFDLSVEQPTPLWGARVSAGYRNGQGKFGPYDEKLITNPEGELRVGVELPLLRGGVIDERRAKIAGSERGLEAAQQAVRIQKLEARRQASHRYFEWVGAAQKMKLAEELLKLALERDEAMAHRVRHGDAAKIEQTDNHRSVAQRRAALVSATRALEKATLELSLFFRDGRGQPISPTSDQSPTGGLALPKSEPTRERIEPPLKTHPEIRRFEAQITQNEIEQKLARNLILPKLDSEVAFSQDLGGAGSSKSILESKAALKLEFPLLFRTALGRSDSITAQGLKLDAQLDLTRDRIRVAVSDASQAVEAARARIFMNLNEIELSKQVEQAERLRLKHGDSSVLTVNLREQATADARSRTIDALTDFYRAKADLSAAIAEDPSHGK